jgi:tRNA G37 N-methylase TrmD
VLLSGNEKEIKNWKEEQSKILTNKWRDYNK